MRKFGQISNKLWKSKKFNILKSDGAKLFYIYCHSCQHGNAAGCFWLPLGYISTDLGKPIDKVKEVVQECVDVGLIFYNWDKTFIRICKFLPLNPIRNAKHAIGVVKPALDAPSGLNIHELFQELAKEKYILENDILKDTVLNWIKDNPHASLVDTSIISVLNTDTDTDTDTDNLTNTDNYTNTNTLAQQKEVFSKSAYAKEFLI